MLIRDFTVFNVSLAVGQGGDQSAAESGARLTCHLLLRLFQSTHNPNIPFSGAKTSGGAPSLKASCERHLLTATHNSITVGAVVSAVDGPISLGDFGEPHQDGSCDHEGQCVLLAIWGQASRQMREILDSYTLADIASIARGEGAWPDQD